jgi:hypothetical protein
MPDLSLTNDNFSENEEERIHQQNKLVRQIDHANKLLSGRRDSTSGNGILEFSASMAGQDVTPANLEFNKKPKRQSTNTSFQSLAGKKIISIIC